jgi:hypothetical protein
MFHQILVVLLISSAIQASLCSTAEAIADIIESHYVENSIDFEVVTCSDSIMERDLIDKILKRSASEYKTIGIKRNVISGRVELDKSAIVICESAENFEKFNQKVALVNKLPKPLNILVYVPKMSLEKLRILPDNSSDILRFQSLMIETEESFEIIGFQWYSNKVCGKRQATTLNTFTKRFKLWSSKQFFVPNLRDFHGCPVSIGVLRGAQPASDAYQPNKDNTSLHFWGYNIQIMEVLSQNLNFKANFNAVEVPKIREMFDKFDYMMFSYGFSFIHESSYYITETYNVIDWVILVPPGHYYTPYEKLLLPFSYETWIWFVVLHIVAIVVILIVKVMSKTVRDFVFGLNVTNPVLNLLIAFTGGGQMVLPGRNFARFILMMYILFSLVVRTAYQGISFELLINDPQRSPVGSVDEMIEGNMSLYYKAISTQRQVEEMDLFPK